MIETHHSPCQSILQSSYLVSYLYCLIWLEDAESARKMNFRNNILCWTSWMGSNFHLAPLPAIDAWPKTLIDNKAEINTYFSYKNLSTGEKYTSIKTFRWNYHSRLQFAICRNQTKSTTGIRWNYFSPNAKFSNKRNITYHLGLNESSSIWK